MSRRAPFTYQPACKPGFVGRDTLKTRVNALLLAARDDHSSGTPVARRLKQPTRTAGSGHRSRDSACARPRAVPIRSCSRWGLPCRFRRRTRGALLPHPFTLAAAKRYAPRRSSLCGTVPEPFRFAPDRPAGRYPAPYVHGARTFLPGDLSAIAGAAVRPTDTIGMGRRYVGVKGGMRIA